MLGGFYEPPINCLALYAPWSLLALWAFWKVVRRPSTGDDERRLERFIFCWFFVGLIIFCVAAHQRGRLIIPLLPAAALLAGRELARLLARWPVLKIAGAVAVLALAGAFANNHFLQQRSRRVQATVAMRDMAGEVRRTLGDAFPLVHVNTPFAIQFYLQTGWPYISTERAAALLTNDYPAFVAVSDYDDLLAHLKTNSPLQEIVRWTGPGKPEVRIFGNRPAAEAADRFATLQGPFLVRLDHAQLVTATDRALTFRRANATTAITLQNQSATPQTIAVRVITTDATQNPAPTSRTLAPNEIWEVPR